MSMDESDSSTLIVRVTIHGNLMKVEYTAKIMSLQFNRIEQCCAVQIVYSGQQHLTIVLRLNCV